MFYKNYEGKRFFKSSDKVRIICAGRKEGVSIDKKRAGEAQEEVNVSQKVAKLMGEAKDDAMIIIYISSENRGEVISSAMGSMMDSRDMGGVYISVSQPTETIVRILEENGVDTKDIYFIDCISRMSSKVGSVSAEKIAYIENPSSLEEISLYLERMLEKVPKKKKFVFIDSLSSLLIYNTEKSVKEFAHFMINRTRLMGYFGIILAIQKKEVDELVKTIAPMCDIKAVI